MKLEECIKHVGKIKSYQQKRTIKTIRRKFALLEYDFSHLSDKEILDGVGRTTKVMANAGITVKEAVEGIQKTANAMIGFGKVYEKT